MKRGPIFAILSILFCLIFTGCHTLNTLSKVHTGNIDLKNIWQTLIQDDRNFQEKYW